MSYCKPPYERKDSPEKPLNDTGPRIMRCAALLRKIAGANENMNVVHDICGRHSWILYYLNDQEVRGVPVFQRDIEKTLAITRSGVSRLVNAMEEKNVIVRKSVGGDARLKQIVLTEYGHRLTEYSLAEKTRLEEQIEKGFAAEEKKQFNSYLDRIADNLSDGHRCGKGEL